jgi:hypothetical protein
MQPLPAVPESVRLWLYQVQLAGLASSVRDQPLRWTLGALLPAVAF